MIACCESTEGVMRGSDERNGDLFSYVDIEERIPAAHPLRAIRELVNEVLAALDGEFSKFYADSGRPSIAPERLLRVEVIRRNRIYHEPPGLPPFHQRR